MMVPGMVCAAGGSSVPADTAGKEAQRHKSEVSVTGGSGVWLGWEHPTSLTGITHSFIGAALRLRHT